jgi:hypothetical protein
MFLRNVGFRLQDYRCHGRSMNSDRSVIFKNKYSETRCLDS